MNLLSLIGLGKTAGDAIATPVDAVGNAFDKLFTSDEEKAQAEIIMAKVRLHPQILQVEINKLEAQHRSLFVSGWRPFIGWICGCGLLINFNLLPLIVMYGALFKTGFVAPQLPGIGELMNLLLALLGMAGLRTWEKSNKLTK